MADTILVIDDDPTTARLLQRTLEAQGYRVVTAPNGQDGVKGALTEHPALILLDVMMPGESGLEICANLRSDPRTAEIPIIMLSARGQVDDKVQGLRAGADEYVTKPIAAAELWARVDMLLERRRRLARTQRARAVLGKAIGVLGAKGGVGTTTLALNVAASLVASNSVVLAELMARWGTLGICLKQTPLRNLADLLKLPAERIDAAALEPCLLSFPSGFRVLYGPQDVASLPEMDGVHARSVLQALRAVADRAVLDLGAAPSPAIGEILPALDLLILAVEPDALCLESAKMTVRWSKFCEVSDAAIQCVIVNRVPAAMSASAQEISEALGCKVLGLIPHAAQALTAAHARGRPLVQAEPESVAAASLREIANRIAAELA